MRPVISLNTRLLLAASVVLAAFLGITGVVLDRTYHASAEKALKDRLQGYANALIAATEPGEDNSAHLANALPVPRFFTPGSGLYGRISSNKGPVAWVSPSTENLEIDYTYGLTRGVQRYETVTASDGASLYTYNIGVTWEERAPATEGYTFSVAERLDDFNAQISSYRRTLWGWLGAVVIILLILQGSILHWGLRPLRRVAEDLKAIEAGEHTQLEGRYPKELRGLTDNLNALIRSEREHLERYRHRLGDLAHSLKTPLALLGSEVDAHDSSDRLRSVVQEQVDQMSQIIEYQLQRAATSGRTALATPVQIEKLVSKVVTALNKVYLDKGVQCQCRIDKDVHFHGDESDLMEVLGNLIDNAFKWCSRQVSIDAHREGDGGHHGVIITVEDDGPGIAPEMQQDVLQRGIRGDERIEGHGIGLAVVLDVVQAYNGRLEIASSPLGGACLTVHFPTTH